jgi:hypothetical protein
MSPRRLSLLLLIIMLAALTAAWAASKRGRMLVGGYDGRRHTFLVAVCDGELSARWVRRTEATAKPRGVVASSMVAHSLSPLDRMARWSTDLKDWQHSAFGFGFFAASYVEQRGPTADRAIWMRCWLPWLVTVGLAGRMANDEARGWRRRTLGLCLRCGYDLRDLPSRCPECGTPHAVPKARPAA